MIALLMLWIFLFHSLHRNNKGSLFMTVFSEKEYKKQYRHTVHPKEYIKQ